MSRTRNMFIPALCFLLLLTGCHISRPAAPDRRATAPLPGPEAWPARDIEAVRDFHERTPEVIRNWELNGLVAEDQLDERSRKALASIEQTVIANRLTDHGLLRVWSYPEGEQDRLTLSWLLSGGFIENASFLSSRDASGYRRERALKGVPDTLGAPRLEKNFFLTGLQKTYSRESVMLGRGIDVRIPTRVRGRGVLVVLGGLFSTTWQESSIDLFEKAGWDVLQIDPVSWTRSPNDDNYETVRDQRSAFAKDLFERRLGWKKEDGSYVPISERRADDDASFEKHLDIYAAAYDEAEKEIPLPPTGFELTPDADPAQVGRTIARAIDDSIAENAYAVEAGMAYLIETHGRDALGAIGVIGYSAGSFAAPAVAARLDLIGVPPDAMILIGSGADLFAISQESTITDGGIDLTGEDQYAPTPEQIGRARDAYLEHTRLDPWALGPALADLPTLLMLASNDKPVPNGELLDERLGYPDRIRYFGGHGGLFYFLPQQTPRMIRWLDRVTREGTARD